MSDLDSFINKFGGMTEEYKFYADQVTLRYDVKNHVYLLLKEDGSLEPQDGVTTICHIIDKSNALIPWACKMMSNRLLADGVIHLPSGEKVVRQMTYPEFEALVTLAKGAHKEKLEEAGEVGHTAHAWIEDYIKLTLAVKVASPTELSLAQEKLLDHTIAYPKDERAASACKAALDWMYQHNVRWLGTERKIYSRLHKYAGTLDGLCIVDSCQNPHCCKKEFKDRLTVSDWKTSNYLYTEYLLQTAAYQSAYIEEMSVTDPHGPLVTDRWVIRLGKDDGGFEAWHADWDDFLVDFAAFRQALELSRSVRFIGGRIQDRERERRDIIKQERQAHREAAETQEKAERDRLREIARAERAAAMRIACVKSAKYKGTRPPTCSSSWSCKACVWKYLQKHPEMMYSLQPIYLGKEPQLYLPTPSEDEDGRPTHQ